MREIFIKYFLRVSDKSQKENDFEREKIIVYSIFYEIIDCDLYIFINFHNYLFLFIYSKITFLRGPRVSVNCFLPSSVIFLQLIWVRLKKIHNSY